MGSKAAGAAFKDTWTLSDLDVAWMGLIADEQPAVYQVLVAAGMAHGKGMQSYLTMMAARLLEMRRVLKPTGSLYLHCDDTAGAWLKTLLDAIFGAPNFRNEITWQRTRSAKDAKRFGRAHDVLLYYAKSGEYTWNTQYQPLDPEYVNRAYRHEDNEGRWQSVALTAAGMSGGESGETWRGIDPGDVGRHWSTPVKGGMNDYIVKHGLIDGWPDAYPSVHARLDALDAAGLIHWPERGAMPRLKRYLASAKGNALDDIFIDIGKLEAASKERIGYPTQKPLALLERIIAASSNPGDVVLDPFAGCATACVAAERLGRRWVGIDLSPKAAELVNLRLREYMGGLFHDRLVTTRTDVPRRTDIDAPKNYRQNKHVLFGRQEGKCAGCRLDFPYKVMEVDHVVPRSKGGGDHMENLQVLCSHCNRTKGDRDQAYLLARLQG